jgi:hypothetical protein
VAEAFRKHARVKKRLVVRGERGGAGWVGYTIDLSTSGLGLHVPIRFARGARMEGTIELDGGRTIAFTGEVKWQRDTFGERDGAFALGVDFDAPLGDAYAGLLDAPDPTGGVGRAAPPAPPSMLRYLVAGGVVVALAAAAAVLLAAR